jgi:hypothetical protein
VHSTPAAANCIAGKTVSVAPQVFDLLDAEQCRHGHSKRDLYAGDVLARNAVHPVAFGCGTC